MIRVTQLDGTPAYVNLLTVSCMLQRDGHTIIQFSDHGEMVVEERAEQILRLLNPTLPPTIPLKHPESYPEPLPGDSGTTVTPQLTSREVLIKACAKDRGAVNKLLATHGVTKLSEASEEVQALVIAELRKLI